MFCAHQGLDGIVHSVCFNQAKSAKCEHTLNKVAEKLEFFVFLCAESELRYARWKKAVQRAMNWETTEPVNNGNGMLACLFVCLFNLTQLTNQSTNQREPYANNKNIKLLHYALSFIFKLVKNKIMHEFLLLKI